MRRLTAAAPPCPRPARAGHTAALNDLCWASPTAALTASADGSAVAWDTRSCSATFTLRVAPGTEATAVATNAGAGGHLVVVGSSKGVLSLFDSRTGKRVGAFEESHGEPITALEFAGAGALVSAGTDGLACVFDVEHSATDEDEALQSVLNTNSSVARMGFCDLQAGDAGALWLTTHVETLQVWDWRQGSMVAALEDARKEVAARLFPAACVAEEDVYLVGCHSAPGGGLCLTAGSADGNVALFPVSAEPARAGEACGAAALAAATTLLSGGEDSHTTVVRGLARSADGLLYTAGEDGALCMWAPGAASAGDGAGDSRSGGADKRRGEGSARRMSPY